MSTPGSDFTNGVSFGSASGPTYNFKTVTAAPNTGNNPQQIDQLVSLAITPAGDQIIWGPGSFTESDLNGFGIGVLAGGASANTTVNTSVVVKFCHSGNTAINTATYTLKPGEGVSVPPASVLATIGNTTITQITCTPSADGAACEIVGTLNLNT
jgi:hypothetical protein